MSDLLQSISTGAKGAPAPAPATHGDAAERRLRTSAIGALLLASALHVALMGVDGAEILGLRLSAGIAVALLALPLVLGGAAIARKSLPLLAASVIAFVAGALAKGAWEVTLLRLGVALLFGFAVLAFVEFTHMLVRYQRLAAAVQTTAAGDTRLAHAMREYSSTFFRTAGIAALACAGVAAAHFAMRYLGPAQWRASFDLAGVWGLVAVALIAIIAAALVALARASDFRLPEREKPKPPTYNTASSQKEADADALE